ncbi:ParA family protein [Leuconostoc citreum]|uniref:ParA family protein n=1 Tax=Leuconostoc citreum TaxID=33964 RepID=UPI0011BB34D7|nr:AAA family ATPase [Leuconostoc citreum]MBE4726741.1 AAA family ATPase [Leuconostoc citreum]MBU7451642.1 AAA family ATPase [Leuconostoc citreum]MCS8587529.1 ParA family protein [Leuconostoc citreum]MCS8598858.1 ParA family protein [Leuconostoc citreum]QEA37537.1 AAA family ATPase [Leuconostoc citreum]
MSAKILTFGNFKGGTGKTTNSTMIGFELSNRNKKVLLLDLDPQGNATNLYLKTKSTLDGEVVIFDTTLMSAIKNEDLSSAIINIKENLDVLPSATDFSLFPRYMEFLANYEDRVRYLSTLIKPLRNKYDYIIIDIPPTISLITDSALFMSDYCIIVLQTHERSLQGAEAFINYIQNDVIDKFKAPTLDVLGVLPVLLKNGAPVDVSTLENAKNEFGEENMFQTTIRNMERLKRYDITGITDEDMHDKRVSQVYIEVTDELLQRIGDN